MAIQTAQITLTAADGFELSAYEARPDGKPKGAVVVIQEIFGVNAHIREVTESYADAGYYAIAPAIFDRAETGVELGYDEAGMGKGMELAFSKLDHAKTLADLQAAVSHASVHGKVGVVGYCFGGLMTWLSACEVSGVAAASAYYGGGIAGQLEHSAKCPVMMHFGELDAHIPMTDVDAVRAAQPEVEVFVYPADHGFNCDHRGSFDAASAAQARERTLEHFAKHLG